MANVDSSPSTGTIPGTETIEERLAPLAKAAPEPTRGRIQTIADARSALRIPTSTEPEILKAWGVPSDFQLVAFPVADEHRPQLVAEFAVLRVMKRQGSKLIARPAGARLHLREKSNALWIVYGSIIQAPTGMLAIESLSIGPALEGQLGRRDDEIALGVTAELLRLLSPARLLSETVEQLQRSGYLLDQAEQRDAQPMSERQRELLKRIEQGRPRQAQISDEELRRLACRYIQLSSYLRHPLPQLALDFGITRTQARDRIHKARQHKYLAPGQPGRATPTPGPRLNQLD
jgi:hypothetical protein